jgi:hypothetical protein
MPRSPQIRASSAELANIHALDLLNDFTDAKRKLGAHHWRVVESVIQHEMSCSQVDKQLGLSRGQASVVLNLAMDRTWECFRGKA